MSVSGSSTKLSLSSEEKDERDRERRLAIAKRLAIEKSSYFDGSRYKKNDESIDSKILLESEIRIAKAQKSLSVFADPKNYQLYSMEAERKLISSNNMNELINCIATSAAKGFNMRILGIILKERLQMALFGCDVNVGICKDAIGSIIEFVGDVNYVRKALRGKSSVFECIDQKDIVLQSSSRPKSKNNSKVTFNEGDSVVYVPLLGLGSGMGVIEIHGLCSNGITSLSSFERPTAAIKAMIEAKDFGFKNTVRLWRLPTDRFGCSNHKDKKDYNAGNYQIVCGRIFEVAHSKNNAVYHGGPRYTIHWEDGLVDEALTATEFLKLYAQTPQSLGCASTLDIEMTEQLLELGKNIGEIFENQRMKDSIKNLKNRLNVPNLKDAEICERSLLLMLAIVRGITEASIIGYNETNKEPFCLVTKSNLSKSSKTRTVSINEIVIKALESDYKTQPLYLMDGTSLQCVTFEMELPNEYTWRGSSDFTRFFLSITRYVHGNTRVMDADVNVLSELLEILCAAIHISWEKDLRNKRRRLLQKEIEALIYNSRKMSTQETCVNIAEAITEIMPGCHVYMGAISEGANTVSFFASNSNSNMIEKVLKRGQGVSFGIIENLDSVLLKPEDLNKSALLGEGALVEVLYGKIPYLARIKKDRGHEKYDVQYQDVPKKVEAGVDISRIIPLHSAFRIHRFGHVELPFLGLPIRNRNKGIGMIGVDNFLRVPKAPYDPQPEQGLVKFVDSIGRMVGTMLDAQRKKDSIRRFLAVTENPNADIVMVADAAFDALTNNLYHIESIVLVRVVYEKVKVLDEKEKKQKEKEDKKKKNQKEKKKKEKEKKKKANEKGNKKDKSKEEVEDFSERPKTNELPRGSHLIHRRGDKVPEVEARVFGYDVEKSSQKSVQKIGDKVVLLLFKLKPEVKDGQGKIYMMGLSSKESIQDPDYEYLETVHRLLFNALQSASSRKAAGDVRNAAIKDIQQLCDSWETMDKHDLFNEVSEIVRNCYFSANMYIGKLGAHNKEIKYICASSHSNMTGKRLLRTMKKGVSFSATDMLVRMGITPASENINRLHHFGNSEELQYPVVIIPIISRIDEVFGVLGIDACDDPTSDSDNIEGTLSFMGLIGSHLSKAFTGYMLQEAREELRRIAYEVPTFREGIREVKKVILNILPYCSRIAEVLYSPRELESLVHHEVLGDIQALTNDEYMVVVQVLKAESLVKNVRGLTVQFFWRGRPIYKSDIASIDSTPFSITIPKGIAIEHATIPMVLKGYVDGTEKEISRKSLSLHYLVNTPLYVIDHIFASPTMSEVYTAKLQIVSKMFSPEQEIALSINSISVKGLIKTDRGVLPDTYISVKWNGDEVAKTATVQAESDPKWPSLNINLQIDPKIGTEKSVLVLEAWDQDALGRGTLLGQLELTQSLLRNTFKSNFDESWHYLTLPKSIDDRSDQGRIKIKGSGILACEMSEEVMREELNVDLKVLENDEVEEEQKVFHLCELRILSARDLNKTWGSFSTSPYVVILFNGEEVGRTSVAKTQNPRWEEEIFEIRATSEEELETSILSVEVLDMGMSGSGTSLGIIEITGKKLCSLLSSSKIRKEWFDLDAKGTDQTNANGQIELAGRPVSAPLTGLDDETKDLGFLELTIQELSTSIFESCKEKLNILVYINSRKLFQSKKVISITDGVIINEKITFRHPVHKDILHSTLRVEIESNSKTYFAVDITGPKLFQFLGQSGCKTSWYSMQSLELTHDDDEEHVKYEVKLRGGPEGSDEIYEDDGREFWLDIMAASSLPVHKVAFTSSRPNPFCYIYWNNRRVGETKVITDSADPIWKKQRFILKTPLIEGVKDSLPTCTLKIDVCNKTKDDFHVIGSVLLKDATISQVLGQKYAQIRWLSIINDSFKDLEVKPLLKVRGGLADAEDDPDYDLGEYKLSIIRAADLATVETFRGSNAYVTIKWNEREIGRTQTIKDSTSPSFENETFIIKLPPGGSLSDQRLEISVYDNNFQAGVTPEFLGGLLLARGELEKFFREKQDDEKYFKLQKSVELTEEENMFVKGSIYLKGSKEIVVNEEITMFKESILQISNVTGLSKTSSFGKGSDTYCIIYRYSRSEGGQDVEIYRTKVVTKTVNPNFNEKVIFHIPEDDDWSGMRMRIEIWDVGGEFMGCVILKDSELKSLLTRDGQDCLTPSIHDLKKKDGMAKHLQSMVQGKVTLSGGSKLFFDNLNINVKEEATGENVEDNEEVAKLTKDEESVVGTERVPVYDESGDSAIVRVYSAKELSKVEVFSQSNPYCIIKWNGKEVGRTATIKSNTNPVWEDEHFDVTLPKDIANSNSTLYVEVWHRTSSDVFLGFAEIQGESLANFFNTSTEKIEFPLKPHPEFSTKQNKYAGKGSVVLSGLVPRLQKEVEAKEKFENELKKRNNSPKILDPELRGFRIELRVVRILGLLKPSFGSNSIFVQIYWPDPNILFTQTEVSSGATDIEFDNEIFILEKVEGFKLKDLTLRLSVSSKGVTGDTFLGEVLFTDEDLVTLAMSSSNQIENKVDYNLKKSSIAKNPKHIKGSIEITAKKIGVKNSKLQTSDSDVQDDMKELELSVLAGSNLAKANTFGLSDPFCIVKWDGVEIGKTSVIENTIDPVWDDEQAFFFRVPKTFGSSAAEKEAAAAKKLRKTLKLKSENSKDDSDKSPLDDDDDFDMDSRELSIDVYDYNRLGGGVFLGSVQLKGQILEDFVEGNTLKRNWFDLTNTTRLKQRDQKVGIQGKLELMIGEKKSEIELLEGADIDIQICSARNLAKIDSFAQTDPFVKIRWNNKIVGKTTVVKNNLNPVWDNERFTFRSIKSIPLIDSVLYCEVWDYSMVGKGNFLGSVAISGASLKDFIENPKFTSQWFTLVKTDYLPEHLQDLVQGEIELKCGYTNAQAATSDKCINYEISIISASDLARADGMFGLSDPYALLKWNGREIGRTNYVSKNLNPVWDNQSFLIPVSEEQEIGSNTLEIEVYDYNLLSNGSFLGCIFLTGDALDEFLNEEDVPSVILNLHKSKSIPEAKQSLVQGKVKIGKKIVSDEDENDGGFVLPVTWQSERDVDAGYPLIELCLLSGRNLLKKTLSISGIDACCDVIWNGELIATSSVASGSDPIWASERFILKIPMDMERKKDAGLLIKAWDKDTFSKRFLGQVKLPLQSLLCCHDGVFELALTPENKYQTVKGTLTFSLRIKYPFWDSLRSNIPNKFPRKIKIISASNLPSINDNAPTTKCVIHFLGINKAKTIVVRSNSSPIWPQVQFELLVDLIHHLDVYLHLYHVDVEDRREIMIGQALIPFEVILRAPIDPIDITLEPPARMPPKKYKFVVNGSVKISISGSSNTNATLPWSANFDIPISSLETHDMHVSRSVNAKEDIMYDGKDLTKEEELWLGAAYNLASVQTLPSRKEWTIVPIYDMGLRIGPTGGDFIGSQPGKRFALCIERPSDKINLSDEILLAEVHESIQHCIIQLRRKEIYRSIRSKILKYYSEELALGNNLPIETYFKWIVRALQTSVPGASIFTATVSTDYKSLIYNRYEPDGATGAVTLYEGQGFDWELAGKNPVKSIIVKSIKDLKLRRMMTFRPGFNTRFPRIVVPLVAGDVSLGLFGVENFDIIKGGVSDRFGAEKEMKTWFEDLGSLFGEAMYSAREKKALKDIEAYILGWSSTRDGLVQEILINLTSVLQGCKLMEVWSVTPEYSMSSIAYFTPQGPPPPGRSVIISVKVKTHQTIMEKGAALVGKGTALLKKGANLAPNDKIMNLTEDSSEFKQTKKKFMFGIRHDDMEQLHVLPETSISPKGDINYEVQDIKVVITNDRMIYLHVYEIDNDLNILDDFNNKVSFQTFKEKKFQTSLYSSDSSTTLDADLNLQWVESGGGDSTAEKLKIVKSFTVSIKSASGLLPPSSGNKLDTFCEIYFGKDKIGRTNVVKDSATPVWNETFTIPFKGKGQPLIIDVFEMTMLGKGPFRGRIEISVEQLVMPPLEEVDYPLSPKTGMNSKKQLLVGGSLCLAYSMELLKVVSKEDNPELDAKLITIPRILWNMQTPAISLTITSASELSKANMFGNGSDAFVILYLGTSLDPIAKTKVIQDDLNPSWNETFTLNLGVIMEPDKTTINDFPKIRLEVWNSSRIGEGAFLGQCEITPVWYFSRKNGDFQLTPNKKFKASKNKLVKGFLSANFKLIDNFADIGKQQFIYSSMKTLMNLQFVEVHIVRCNDLLKANRFDGKSDPYVKIIWNDKIYGETVHKKGTLDPQWNNEKFIINLSTVGYRLDDMVLEVWDKDFFSEGEFMGEYRIPSENYLHPSEGNQKVELQNKPGQPKGKIKGTITFKLVQRFKMQRVDVNSRDYIEEKTRAHKSLPSPLPVAVIRDPLEEARRQSYEKSNYPGILSKAEENMNKYLNNPFERNGLISELHYGQIISSCQRSEHTVIKTEKADMFCVPTSLSQKDIDRKKVMDKSQDTKIEDAKDPDVLYIIARYDSGRLSKRDSSFLSRVKDVLVAGIASVGKRQFRINTRALLEDSLKTLGSSAKDNFHGALVQGIMDVEYALGCQTKIFLLNSDGKTFSEFVRNKSKLDKRSTEHDEYIQKAAKVCRHGFVLQFYRGKSTVIDIEWQSQSQMGAVSFESIMESVDEVEGVGLCQTLIDMAWSVCPEGNYLVPLMATNEVLNGMMLVNETNKIPNAVYKYKDITKKAKPVHTSRRNKGVQEEPLIELHAPEDGVSTAIVMAANNLGKAITSSRLGSSFKKIKGYKITPATRSIDIIRYVFLAIVKAVPQVREIAIWGLDFNRKYKVKEVQKETKSNGVLGFLFGKSRNNDNDNSKVEDVNDDHSTNTSPCILAGYWGTEDPQQLLDHQDYQEKLEAARLEAENKSSRDSFSIVSRLMSEPVFADWQTSVPKSIIIDGTPNESIRSGISDSELVQMIHAEAVRCRTVLKQTVFRTVSGHLLASIGTEKAAYEKLEYLFDQNFKEFQEKKNNLKSSRAKDRLKAFEEEKAKKLLNLQEEQMALEAQKRMLESLKGSDSEESINETMKKLKKIEAESSVDETKYEEDFVSDSDSDNEINYFKTYKKTIAVPDVVSITDKNAPPAVTRPIQKTIPPPPSKPNLYTGHHITGTSNVEHSPRPELTPRSAATRPTAPLPSGLPPSRANSSNNIVTNSTTSNKDDSNIVSSIANTTKFQTIPRQYFIAIKTNGLGGDTGWGVIGETIEKAIAETASALDQALVRRAKEKTALREKEEKLNKKAEDSEKKGVAPPPKKKNDNKKTKKSKKK